MSLSDAELLDVVRKLRLHMASIDTCHSAVEKLNDIEEPQISDTAKLFAPEIQATNLKISKLLKLIENGKCYRTMIQNFNVKKDQTEEEDEW